MPNPYARAQYELGASEIAPHPLRMLPLKIQPYASLLSGDHAAHS